MSLMQTVAADTAYTLAESAQRTRSAYAQRVTDGTHTLPWWTTVIITAGSQRQAERYTSEIQRRQLHGTLPTNVRYLVVPDLEEARIGSGGATLHALHTLAAAALPAAAANSLEEWWAEQRVLIIHSGGDARRLPQYSLSGKLFSILPITTPWGEVSTVFDELLALSTAWVDRLACGLVVTSGDVLPTFNAETLRWERAGVAGVAMRSSLTVGSRHGVYVADDEGRVYAFLQKPTPTQVRDAGGMLPDEQVAVDSGIFRFDAVIAARLTALAGVQRDADCWRFDDGLLARTEHGRPALDLYEHFTLALTGQSHPGPDELAWQQLATALQGVPFWCDLVDGEFTHIGTTPLFRQLMTEETNFTRLYETPQRLSTLAPPGVRSAGVIIDSVLAGGGEIGAGAMVIECALNVPVHAGRGAILHGVADLSTPVEAPDDVVVHQVPVRLPDGLHGVVMRVYGVEDDPKGRVFTQTATWFGRPLLETLALLQLEPEQVWPDIAPEERTLWNALLFPVTTPAKAWAFARWMLGLDAGVAPADWARTTRLSLASSAHWADSTALAEARQQRIQANWSATALSLAQTGSDLRPLLAHPPGLTTLAGAARALWAQAAIRKISTPTEAASLYLHASRFFQQAGLAEEAGRAHTLAFACVRHGVETQALDEPFHAAGRQWQARAVTVSAPARIDFGGGWSDTPPFCLDWGGTVLNMALTLQGAYPITTHVRWLNEPVLSCISDDTGERVEYRDTAEVLAPPRPGDTFAIPRAIMQLIGLVRPGEALARALLDAGGGLEIRTSVSLPLGSGLGTSSILAATALRAVAEMFGVSLSDHQLSEQVLQLEQRMATGGGWQDQAGGIFPGVKLLTSGPGLRQRLRVQPLGWTPARQQEFSDRFILYYTGIRRIAKNLLGQVVERYLAREADAVQVLHSIKTLAQEMAYAMCDGEWEYLGSLIDRHWRLNQQLDPHTTNAPISALLQDLRPYLAGAKLAGAGGGGFLLLLAKDPDAAQALRTRLATGGYPGALYTWALATDGLRVERT